MKKNILYFIRIAVTAGLIWFLISKIDLSESLSLIANFQFGFLAPAVAVALLAWFINAIRWNILLKVLNVRASPVKLFLYNVIGVFYSIVLPGGKLTGDAISAYRFMKDDGGGRLDHRYFLSTFIDRLLGFIAILALISLFFIFNHPAVEVFGSQGITIGIFTSIITAFALTVSLSNIFDFILRWFSKWKIMITLIESLENYRRQRSKILIGFLISIISFLGNSFSVYLLSIALGINQDFLTIAFAYLFATSLIVIPATIAGIGLREGGLIYILAKIGVDVSRAAALSIIMLAVFGIFALAGGVTELILALKKR